jgi:hypothetical protein
MNPNTSPRGVPVANNLPALIDALSKPGNFTMQADINIVPYSQIFCATVLHKVNFYIFQALFWDQN